MLHRLTEWGVHRIYGYPGDGINGFLGALDRADGDPSSVGYVRPRVLPQEGQLDRAAEILKGEKVAILIGQGAADAADEVVETAELLGAGVAKAPRGPTPPRRGVPVSNVRRYPPSVCGRNRMR